MIFQFGRVPVRIDLLIDPSGIEFELCFSRRNEVIVDEIRVPLISLEDLRANKLASGRPKDLADLEGLPSSKGPAARRHRKQQPRDD